MGKKREFGELEEAIIQVLMTKNRPLSVKAVQQSLKNQNAYTTIMTVLTRLYEKGVLSRTKDGRSYLYQLKHPQQKAKHSLFKRLKTKILTMSPSQVFNYFLENQGEISEGELRKMEKLIRDYKKSRGRS